MMKRCAILGDDDDYAMQPLIPEAVCGVLCQDIKYISYSMVSTQAVHKAEYDKHGMSVISTS